MTTKIFYDKKELHAAIQQLAQIVGSTMGPFGRMVLLQSVIPIEKDRQPDGKVRVTGDGISVAKHLFSSGSRIVDYGWSLLKSASEQLRKKVGDGTTNVVVLTAAMCVEVGDKVNPHSISRGMDLALERFVKELKSLVRPVTSLADLVAVARISSKGDPFASKIAGVVYQLGKDGVVYFKRSLSGDSSVEVMSGFVAKWTVFSDVFMKDRQAGNVSESSPFLALLAYKVRDFEKEIAPIMGPWLKQAVVPGGIVPLVIFLKDCEGTALKALVNARNSFSITIEEARKYGFSQGQLTQLANTRNLPVYLVRCGEDPGEELMDLASMLSETPANHVFSTGTGNGIRDFKPDSFLRCKDFFADSERVVISADESFAESRLSELRSKLDESQDFEPLAQRIASLTGGVGYVKIGGMTPSEVESKMDVAQDVQQACFSALNHGTLPGSGVPLAHFSTSPVPDGLDKDTEAGYVAVRDALFSPFKTICENAGREWNVDAKVLSTPSYGLDMTTGEPIEDLFAAGIVDPAESVIEGLKTAVSTAKNFVLTKYIIINE